MYRLWSTERGGVYAPRDGLTPANPYLSDIPDRDITCSNGKAYTLVNPAYMTRMVHELGARTYGLRGHITSLSPLRPENGPDPWETRVLKRFEKGEREYWEEQTINSASTLRYMGAFVVQPGCLRCHAKQGYHVGDVRGGISVTVPLSEGYYATLGQSLRRNGAALSTLWLVGMLGIVWLAKREHATEGRARRAREMRDAMFRSGGIGILVVSPDHTIVAINPRACELLGSTCKQFIGQNLEQLHGENGSFPEFLRQHGIGDKTTTSFEWLVRRRDASPLWCTATISPLDPKNPHQGSIWGLTDTSTLHAVQNALTDMNRELVVARDKALGADRLKAEFLANMSHELRSPLHAILGMVDALARSKLTADQAACVSAIDRSSDGLLVILNDILDFSKLAEGQFQLDHVVFEIREELQCVTQLFDSQLDHSRVVLELSVAPDVPTATLGDPVRFRQIMSHLLSNAIKFTQVGNISLRVSCLSKDATACRVRCEVTDTGIGIPEDQQENLFLPFNQADNSSTRRFGGTGLGLTLVKNLTEAMNGKVSFQSKRHQGSSFVVELPFAVAAPRPVLPASSPPLAPIDARKLIHLEHGAPSILIVDDAPINQLVAAKLVESAGGKVTLASGGIEAVSLCKHTNFDLILMDCLMPDMDGFEATRQIRNLESGTKRHVPIVAVTASALADDRARCINAGMDDYMSKPVAADALVRCINDWLRKSAFGAHS